MYYKSDGIKKNPYVKCTNTGKNSEGILNIHTRFVFECL